jgi:hypothetical protein
MCRLCFVHGAGIRSYTTHSWARVILPCSSFPRWLEPTSSIADTKALIITHELSREKEMDDYLARVLFPLRPLLVMGRSRMAEPACRPEESLFYCWKVVE